MPRTFLRNKSGQNIIEYALIITLVITGVLVIGPTVIRSWNAVVKGFDDDVQDSYNDPLNQSNITDNISGCTCNYIEPCDTPPCCGVGGCADDMASEIYYCNPQGCDAGPPNCTPDPACCRAPVPTGVAPDDCGTGGCGPDEVPGEQICNGGASTRPACVPDLRCSNFCMNGSSGLPVNFDSFEADDDFYFGRCPRDDEDLSVSTVYSTVPFGQCSNPDGSRPKCELQCARGMVPTFGNATCGCPGGCDSLVTSGPLTIQHTGVDCSSCPFGVGERCDTLNPTQCDRWCLPDPNWRGIFTWNTNLGPGGWQCPGNASANPGCINEQPTTNNQHPYCQGGHLIRAGNHRWSMHGIEGGLCADPRINEWRILSSHVATNVTAICSAQGSLIDNVQIISVLSTTQVGTGSQATAVCPSGTRIVGGGVNIEGSAFCLPLSSGEQERSSLSSYPTPGSDTQWFGSINCGNTRTYALCAPESPELNIVYAAGPNSNIAGCQQINANLDRGGISVATCPAGYKVISGGYRYEGYDNSCSGECSDPSRYRYVAYSRPVGEVAWEAASTCSHLTAFAVCARDTSNLNITYVDQGASLTCDAVANTQTIATCPTFHDIVGGGHEFVSRNICSNYDEYWHFTAHTHPARVNNCSP